MTFGIMRQASGNGLISVSTSNLKCATTQMIMAVVRQLSLPGGLAGTVILRVSL
jgi:hypothetical protein